MLILTIANIPLLVFVAGKLGREEKRRETGHGKSKVISWCRISIFLHSVLLSLNLTVSFTCFIILRVCSRSVCKITSELYMPHCNRFMWTCFFAIQLLELKLRAVSVFFWASLNSSIQSNKSVPSWKKLQIALTALQLSVKERMFVVYWVLCLCSPTTECYSQSPSSPYTWFVHCYCSPGKGKNN